MLNVSLDQFLTASEIHSAVNLYNQLHHTGRFASVVSAQVIKPNIDRINEALGQENSPLYLAYMVEHVLNQLERVTK